MVRRQAKERPGPPVSSQPLNEVVRVRVSTQMNRRLRKDAKLLGISESEAVRLGLEMVHRRARRQANMHHLMDEAGIVGGSGRLELE